MVKTRPENASRHPGHLQEPPSSRAPRRSSAQVAEDKAASAQAKVMAAQQRQLKLRQVAEVENTMAATQAAVSSGPRRPAAKVTVKTPRPVAKRPSLAKPIEHDAHSDIEDRYVISKRSCFDAHSVSYREKEESEYEEVETGAELALAAADSPAPKVPVGVIWRSEIQDMRTSNSSRTPEMKRKFSVSNESR